ncbi:MAG: GAF domain-containing protein [Anaerolineaceae bacterium]|nr:GAF domain-containing protein [Anaerolineaceae bacterium]
MAKQKPSKPAAISAQQQLALGQTLFLALETAVSAESAFTHTLEQIGRQLAWPLAHAYRWSEAQQQFVSSKIWYQANEGHWAAFRAQTEARPLTRHTIPGPLRTTGEPLLLANMAQAAHFAPRQPALAEGLTGYLALPVKVDGAVTAVLEFFLPTPADLPPKTLVTLTHLCQLLAATLQRQQTQHRLQKSQAQLAEAQRLAQVGHWEWSLASGEIIWSAEMYRIFGLNPATFTAQYQTLLEFVHPDDQAYVRSKVALAQQTGQPFDYFHRIIRPDGAERVLHARGQAQHDPSGRLTRLYGTVQDMTHQKEAELKLAQTVRQLTAMMEIGQAVTSTLDLNQLYDKVLALVRPLINAKALLLFLHNEGTLNEVARQQEGHAPQPAISLPLPAGQAGIEGEVWHSRQSLLLQEKACQQRLLPHHQQRLGFQPKSMALVPILLSQETLGVLEAAHPHPDAFDAQDLRLLEIATAWTAIAIGNARQYAQLQRRLSESSAIADVSNAMTETLELESLLQLIVERTYHIVPHAEWSTIHLYQAQGNLLELAASAGRDVDPAAYTIKLGEGITGHVMAEGGLVNVPDVQVDPRRLAINRTMNVRAMLVVPVESRRRRIGTISVQSTTPAIFTADDERLLTVLGVQAGIALENARLYRSQQRARRLAEQQRHRMQQLARRVVEAQESERQRIARELHDESGQALTSLKISLDMIRATVPAELESVRQGLQDVLDLTDRTMSNLRLLSHNLRPPGLDSYGLNAALEGLCHDFSLHAPLKVTYAGQDLPGLKELPALSLYRFAQEALTNAAKHAEASAIEVTLACDSDMISLTVQDNGQGFLPPDLDNTVPADGAGLVGIVERLEMVDGRLTIHTAPGQGATLVATIPAHTNTNKEVA